LAEKKELKAPFSVRNLFMNLTFSRQKEKINMTLKTTDLCVIRLRKGERISAELADVLDEVNIASIHAFEVPPERPTELHYHDFDEYWLFTGGSTTMTLRLPDGTMKEYEIGPGDLIATPKGVEHGHIPKEAVRGFEFSSKIKPGARGGHLQRNVNRE